MTNSGDIEKTSQCFENPEGLGIWDTRYAGLNTLISAYIEDAESVEHPYWQTVHDLLERLKIFGGRQYSFFRDRHNVDEPDQDVLDPISTADALKFLPYTGISYPIHDFILWLISNKISNDALAIHEVLEQRRNPLGIELTRLNDADQIAYSVFQTLSSAFSVRNPYNENVQFISYFKRGVSVRTLPYAPVALISIPLSSAFEPRDLISIAHEVAHFYYWYGQVKNDEPIAMLLSRAVQKQREELEESTIEPVPPIQHWGEEIFADVISVLIAGPVAAYSIQETEQIPVGIHFNEEPGVHPISSIRPFIHALVLKKIGNMYELESLQKAGSELEARWEYIREKRDTPPVVEIDPPSALPLDPGDSSFFNEIGIRSNAYSIPAVRTVIELLIDEILALVNDDNGDWIAGQFVAQSGQKPKAWTTGIDLCDPYAEFNSWLGNFEGQDPDLFVTKGDLSNLWETLVDDLLRTRDVRRTVDGPVLTHAELSGALRPEEWIEIMRFAGWTTEGPTGRGH